jgi:hypothetical protein
VAFDFRPARRQSVPLLIGLAGATGSGKTYTAMRVAAGIAGAERFCVIDTEAGRAKHYADQFKFDHGDLAPPFTPDRYGEAIAAADAAKYPVIVVDSVSHEHAGDGGLLDWHEGELQRMAKDDWKKREACNMAAWIKPKMAHKQFVQQLLQIRAHLILCFRAEAKIEMARGEGGKLEVREKQSLVGYRGWIPITEKSLPFELTLFVMLLPDRPGVAMPIKVQAQHLEMVPKDSPITEETGQQLATWARGDAPLSPDEARRAMSVPLLDTAPATPTWNEANIPAAPAESSPTEWDWLARIHAARTRDELRAVNRQLKAAVSTMPAKTVATLRKAYDAHSKAAR